MRPRRPGPGGPSPKQSLMATTTPPVRLLIVDDDEALRQTLARRFQRLGMAVAEAADGEEALAKAGHTAYDVALLDLHMPGMTGRSCWAGSRGCGPSWRPSC